MAAGHDCFIFPGILKIVPKLQDLENYGYLAISISGYLLVFFIEYACFASNNY